MFIETCVAPVNIALIKYWGKRDEDLILPINDSLSMTLSIDVMCAKTTIAASQSFERNTMWLNGKEVAFNDNPRIARCLGQLQRLALAKGTLNFPIEWNLHIASENNFPTAAGLASSAAGYACLVYTLACLFGIEDEELTVIARQGSGSACRSMYGGFVHWVMGSERNKKHGNDSTALVVAPPSHWPNMHVLILVVNDADKKVSSTKGMQCSVETSDLLGFRAKYCVPKRIDEIKRAIMGKNFPKFAEITMKDSNQFHAIAQDTYPPCIYMNDTSHAIVEFVHAYNAKTGDTRIAYTFDAGPNACLYLLKEDVPQVAAAIRRAFPNNEPSNVEYMKGIPVEEYLKIDDETFSFPQNEKNLLKCIIHTKIGDGPQRLTMEKSLLNPSDGLPYSRC